MEGRKEGLQEMGSMPKPGCEVKWEVVPECRSTRDRQEKGRKMINTMNKNKTLVSTKLTFYPNGHQIISYLVKMPVV